MTNQGLRVGHYRINGRSRRVSVGKRDIFKLFKTGETKMEMVKNENNWRLKRRKLKELNCDGLDLLRKESSKNSAEMRGWK